MCGIFGAITFHGRPERRAVDACLDTLRHRGPNSHGVYAWERVALAHRRLSIIDLSERAHQPLMGPDGLSAIIFNGEIYNYVELRRELELKGERFQSDGDTEVLLRLYLTEGEGFLDRVVGMFAFAILDKKRRKLLLARDRFGKKPLYYAGSSGQFLFGSELKSLLAWPGTAVEPDLRAISLYLGLGYIPHTHCAFKGHSKLAPGHSLKLDIDTGRFAIRRYWRLEPALNSTPSDLRSSVEEAVRVRLRSDAPLGCLLSGGIDSAIVAALASRHIPRLHTFTIGFEGASRYDERALARTTARHIGSTHEDAVVAPQIDGLLDRLSAFYDEPFGDSSAIPSMLVAEMASRHLKVVLNGDGADELFGGYDRYRALLMMGRAMTVPGLVGIAKWSKSWPEGFPPFHRLRRFLDGLSRGDLNGAYTFLQQLFPRASLRDLAGEALTRQPGVADSEQFVLERLTGRSATDDGFRAIMDFELGCYLPDDLLVKMDIACMSVSLEGRSPFLDHRVAAVAAALPREKKFSWRTNKIALRETFRDLLPDEIWRQPKRGFSMPIDDWFRHELRGEIESVLDGAVVSAGIIRSEPVRRLIDAHISGRRDEKHKLWALVVLEHWWKHWFGDAS